MAVAQPQPQMSTSIEPAARAGRNELGTISIADGVVSKIAARAAAENPDAGAAAARMLGRAVPAEGLYLPAQAGTGRARQRGGHRGAGRA